MRKIQIGDFKLTTQDKEAINKVVESNRVTEYTQTKEFEKKWAKAIGTKYAIAVNSGTSALISGLHALKYLANDSKRKKVITTPVTYIATSNAIKLSGLEPVYGDIDKRTFGLKTSEIERILQEHNPKEFLAILPVHLMGYPCEMDKINKIAKKYDLFVAEDTAQAHGTKYKDKLLGSFGDLSFYSFYVAHNISIGEMGAVNTDNIKIRNLVRQIKSNGRLCVCDICRRMEGKCPELLKQEDDEDFDGNKISNDFDPRFTHNVLGFNFKTNEFTSAIANQKIGGMDEINKQRRSNVKYLNDGLKQYSRQLQLPIYSEEVSYLGYPLIAKEETRKDITRKLESKGIETRPLYGCIPTQQPSFSYLKEEYKDKLPNAEYIGKNGFYIGCHQYLNKNDLDYIVKGFGEVLKNG